MIGAVPISRRPRHFDRSAFPAGGYRFIAHQFQYSGGIAAKPGFRIERARFTSPLPLAEGFDAMEAYLTGIGRSPAAFCACELRSPAQFTDVGFVAFNRHYVERLAGWGIFRDEVNPVARSNVCPEIDPPATPSFYAFSYTVPSEKGTGRSFVGPAAAKHARAAPAMKDGSFGAATSRLRLRMAALGFGWADVAATQVYTIFNIHPLLADEIVRRGATLGGFTWHFARPPVQGLDFEMDVRGVAHELVI
jgi:hypothetical protein